MHIFLLVDIDDLKEVLLCQAMIMCTLLMLLQAKHRNWVSIFLALANDTLINILIKKNWVGPLLRSRTVCLFEEKEMEPWPSS